MKLIIISTYLKSEEIIDIMFIVCFLLTILGAVLFYLTHPNQRWLSKALSQPVWRYLSYVLFMSGLLGASWVVSASAALFSWMVMVMLVLGVLPFATIVFRRVDHD